MRLSVRLYREPKYGYWYISVRQEGRRQRWSTGIKSRGKNPPEAAEAIRRRTELALAEGKPLVDTTLAPFLDEYLSYCETRNAPRTLVEKRRFKKLFLAYFGDVPLGMITRTSIEGYIKHRDVGAPTTNRELAMLKHALNYALDRELIIRNPAARFPKLPERRRDIRLLTTKELYTWFTWCRKEDRLMYDLSVIAFNTGQRPGDILKIKGGDINLEMELLKIIASKTGKTNYIPLNDIALAVLRRRSRKGYIFLGREGHLSYSPFYKRFLKAKAATGIEFRFYDFRHNAAIKLLEAGADVVTVSDILDHSDIKITRDYYLKIVDEKKRVALQRLAAKSASLKPYIPDDLTPSDFDDIDD